MDRVGEGNDWAGDLMRHLPELVALRRDIHRHPELGFEVQRTADLVAECLVDWGIAVHRGLAKTGVVGTLTGRAAGDQSIALRADMDALAMAEESDRPHRSLSAGRMHACGHDGHTAMLLGAARILAERRDFAGTVHFIFQPAEEGLGGARVMIEEGLFDKFPVGAVFGMHTIPGLATGQFAIRAGGMMACSDTWTATFMGTGGHGAMPYRGADPTIPAAEFIPALQSIVGRSTKATDPAVISVGYIHAGHRDTPNVIPDRVEIKGTARAFSPAVRDTLERRLSEVANGIAAANCCNAEIHYNRRYPPLVNAPEPTAAAIAAAGATVGAGKVDGNAEPMTISDDFAFFLDARPGAYILLGSGEGPGLHSPSYDFNDDILPTGVAYWINLCRQQLGPGAAA
jgi:hippurate hydrolase